MRIGARAVIGAVVALIAAILGGFYAADSHNAGAVRIETWTVPPVFPADNVHPGILYVRVVGPHGPRAGDEITVLAGTSNGAFVDRTVGLTDSRGLITFHYKAGLSNPYQPAGPVPVSVTDASLGRVVAVEKEVTATMHSMDPAALARRFGFSIVALYAIDPNDPNAPQAVARLEQTGGRHGRG